MVPDALRTLTAPSWRGIFFPVTSLENGFTHDHVEHKFTYTDGMRIETTGRNGLNFSARIPFNNGVAAGDFEPWKGQVLFPTLFRKFLNSCLDGSTGEFMHPDFGPLKCKSIDVNWRYSSALRDGAELTVRWFQTTEDDSEILTAKESPGAAATKSAATLDSAIASTGPLPELSNQKDSFSNMVADYQSGNGSLGPIHSKLDSTSSALDRMDDVSFWPLRQATEDMRAAIYNLGGTPGVPAGSAGSTRTREYTVPFGSSLSSIGITLGIRTDSLVSMNPSLARDPYVRQGSVIRYRI